MAVTMEQVRAALDPEEPDYLAAAELGADALPHLDALVRGENPMLASKATYLASLIDADASADVVRAAAQRDEAAVRVAAAAAARNLRATEADDVLQGLVTDQDVGVRKVARASAPAERSEQLEALLAEEPPTDATGRQESPSLGAAGVQGQPMPGESFEPGMPGEGRGTMPGETSSGMPGEGRQS